jgi:hypothetical protein
VAKKSVGIIIANYSLNYRTRSASTSLIIIIMSKMLQQKLNICAKRYTLHLFFSAMAMEGMNVNNTGNCGISKSDCALAISWPTQVESQQRQFKWKMKAKIRVRRRKEASR